MMRRCSEPSQENLVVAFYRCRGVPADRGRGDARAILQTNWFKGKVRARIVSIAETATGGRVEIGTFDYNWRNLTVELAPFVVHGKERPGEAPFLERTAFELD